MSLPSTPRDPGHIDYTEFLAATLDRSISGFGMLWDFLGGQPGYFSRVPRSERLIRLILELLRGGIIWKAKCTSPPRKKNLLTAFRLLEVTRNLKMTVFRNRFSKHWTIPSSYTSPARPPYIPQKLKNTFSQKNNSKISKINSRINFIQKYPRNYCSISSQIAYKFLLCFFVKMCFAKLHFLTVHLQTSHSISI